MSRPKAKGAGTVTAHNITEYDGHKFKAMEGNVIVQATPIGKDLAVVSVSVYQGKTSLDLRRFYLNDSTEEWCPTAKGIRIPAASANDFLATLEAEMPAIEARLAEVE